MRCSLYNCVMARLSWIILRWRILVAVSPPEASHLLHIPLKPHRVLIEWKDCEWLLDLHSDICSDMEEGTKSVD